MCPKFALITNFTLTRKINDNNFRLSSMKQEAVHLKDCVNPHHTLVRVLNTTIKQCAK